MTNTIYIVRHGQTEWNLLGKTQGHGNSDLTPKGIEQAELLADSMTKYPIDYIYSSDLGRAYQTEPHLAKIPQGETLSQIKERTDAFIKEINEKYDGKHIVLVTHSLCARIMLLSFLDSDVKNIYRINQANTALNIIELRDYGPVVMKMNDTTHIINDIKLENSALE